MYSSMEQLNVSLVSVLLLGESGVGKSALVQRFIENTFSEHSLPTVESAVHRFEAPGLTATAQIVDTSGHSRYWQAISRKHMAGAAVVILVYDVTRRSSLDSLDKQLAALQFCCQSDCLLDVSVLGNKIDLRRQAEVSTAEGRVWAEQRCLRHYSVSAKTGLAIDSQFSSSVAAVFSRLIEQLRQPASEENSSEYEAQTGHCQCFPCLELLSSLSRRVWLRLRRRCTVEPV